MQCYLQLFRFLSVQATSAANINYLTRFISQRFQSWRRINFIHYSRFGETCCVHLQDSLRRDDLYYPEDGSCKIRRNGGNIPIYTISISEHCHHHQKLPYRLLNFTAGVVQITFFLVSTGSWFVVCLYIGRMCCHHFLDNRITSGQIIRQFG
jgi:hypothetical protein